MNKARVDAAGNPPKYAVGDTVRFYGEAIKVAKARVHIGSWQYGFKNPDGGTDWIYECEIGGLAEKGGAGDPPAKKPITGIRVKLVGEDGNAFAIIGRCRKALRSAGRTELVEVFTNEAVRGNYNDLLATVIKYFSVD